MASVKFSCLRCGAVFKRLDAFWKHRMDKHMLNASYVADRDKRFADRRKSA